MARANNGRTDADLAGSQVKQLELQHSLSGEANVRTKGGKKSKGIVKHSSAHCKFL